MGRIAERIAQLGLVLPPAMTPPPGVVLPFDAVRIVGDRAIISGHGPQSATGAFAQPLGKVGREVGEAQAYEAARLTALSVLGSLERALGDLDRVSAWVRVFGMVAGVDGFQRQPAVINGFSDLVLQVFGPEVGAHARSAIGVYELPFNIPVEVEAEVLVAA